MLKILKMRTMFLAKTTTVMTAKNDIDVMLCLQSYHGPKIDRSLVYLSYPQDRINTQMIY